MDVIPEDATDKGRIDMTALFNNQVYIFEFKVEGPSTSLAWNSPKRAATSSPATRNRTKESDRSKQLDRAVDEKRKYKCLM